MSALKTSDAPSPQIGKLSGRLKQWLRHFRATPPAPVSPDWFLPAEVARLHKALQPASAVSVDDTTWADLEVERYLRLLSGELSLFGRQVLTHRLRSYGGLASDGFACAPDALLLSSSPASALRETALAQAAMAALAPLRQVNIDVAGLLFDERLPTPPRWAPALTAVPLGFLGAAALLGGGAVGAAVLLAVTTLVLSSAAQLALHGPMKRWQRQRRALLAMMLAAKAVASAVQQALPSGATPWGRLAAAAAQSTQAQGLLRCFEPGWVERVPALADYANLVAAYEYRRFLRALRRLEQQRQALCGLFEHMACLEADLALHLHVHKLPVVCRAQVQAGAALAAVGLVHPLLPAAHPLSFVLDCPGAFISGQNGAGKSTLLRSVGLNLLVAQGFGFCYAQRATLPRAPVFSSLQSEDSLGTATSLFGAELKRASDLHRAAQQHPGAVFLVDELFRGTNPVESVAATAALGHALARRGPVLLASHHLALASALAATFTAWCVERDAGGAAVLRPGVLTQTNALALLAEQGFPSTLLADAQRVAGWLQSQTVVLSAPPVLSGSDGATALTPP